MTAIWDERERWKIYGWEALCADEMRTKISRWRAENYGRLSRKSVWSG